jgi:hypothetical protein
MVCVLFANFESKQLDDPNKLWQRREPVKNESSIRIDL